MPRISWVLTKWLCAIRLPLRRSTLFYIKALYGLYPPPIEFLAEQVPSYVANESVTLILSVLLLLSMTDKWLSFLFLVYE